jgi:hypothetical protein
MIDIQLCIMQILRSPGRMDCVALLKVIPLPESDDYYFVYTVVHSIMGE